MGEGVHILSAQKDVTGNKDGSATRAILGEVEIADPVHLREEEKLARDVYRHLHDVWGQWIFENIAASEQLHMDAVKNIQDRYKVDDPVGDNPGGVFSSGDLQVLYNSLVEIYASDVSTELNAMWVGATVEDMDIFDIRHMLENTDKPDLISVYENHRKGSRNHSVPTAVCWKKCKNYHAGPNI